MTWTEVAYGVVKAAIERFWLACGTDAKAVMDRMNRDPEYVVAIADFARSQIVNEVVKNFTPPPSHTHARAIMGRNFFGIEEAIRHFGVKPTEEQLKALENIPFSEVTLNECKDTHILVADFGLSVLDVRKKANQLFPKQQNWYKNEKFANDRGTPCWHLVRKTPVEGSFSKSCEEQKALLGQNDEVPAARIVVYTTIGHFLATGKRLFEKCYVRTSDVDSDGSRVRVGYFGSGGLVVSNGRDDNWVGSIGLGSARKSDT